MKSLIAVLLVILSIGVSPIAAAPLVGPANLYLEGLAEQHAAKAAIDIVVEADERLLTDSSSNRNPASGTLSDAGQERPSESDDEAGVAYELTGSLTVGFSYDLEEREDLSKEAQSGTVSENYENHTLLLRASWRLN